MDEPWIPKGWGYIDSVHEIKPRSSPLETICQLAQSARLIFRHQPNRRFVLMSFLNGPRIFLVVFDRSGVVCSTGFDIHDHPELFLRIVLGFTFAEPKELGFDPTVTLDKNNKGLICVGDVQYIIDDVIYVEGVIRGRGTVCYRVHHESQPTSYLVAKDSWVDTSREERECNILMLLGGVPGIPKMIAHSIVNVDSTSDTTARFRKRLLVEAHRSKNTQAVHWTWADDHYASVEIREHRRIVTSPYAAKLEEFPSLLVFVQVIRDIAISE